MWFQAFSGLLFLLLSPCLAVQFREPPAPTRQSTRTPVEGWVDVRLNHFMASDTRTFKMRYYYNDEFASRDIVIVVGGEWQITPGYTTGGLAYELAEKTSSALFYTEHRFYGLTRPFEETSLSGLAYLTVDQALADLAQFIEYVKSDNFENGRYRHAKVALEGCSYAGSMVTWMRLAYPHLVDAAFSDSGPLYAQEDFPEYLEVITKAIASQGSDYCVASIHQGMERVVELLSTTSGASQVSEMFRTCSPIDASNSLDVATFFWYGITETFAYLVQYARPGHIPQACEALTDSTISDPAQRLASWIISRPTTQPCVKSKYSDEVTNHRNTSFDSSDATMRLWTYQTCVEFGWYQTTTSFRQPFLSTVPLEYFHQMCKDFFSGQINESLLRSGIRRTNLFFGGRYLPDRVVSVVGSHDPWSPMGPRASNAHSQATVHIVPEVSHCMAIGSTNSTNIEELERTKKKVLEEMHSFLLYGELMYPSISAAVTARGSILLSVIAVFYCLNK